MGPSTEPSAWTRADQRSAERLTIRQGPLATMCSVLSLLSLILGGPVLAWVRTVYTRLSGTNDRAPFRSERTGNFPVAANETAADMLCCALYPRIQTFPSTDLHLHGGDLVLVLCVKSTSVNRRSGMPYTLTNITQRGPLRSQSGEVPWQPSDKLGSLMTARGA